MKRNDLVSSAARPHDTNRHPVEQGVPLSRAARRLLGYTGAVSTRVPNLRQAASNAATF